jgi:hypothetical protein
MFGFGFDCDAVGSVEENGAVTAEGNIKSFEDESSTLLKILSNSGEVSKAKQLCDVRY